MARKEGASKTSRRKPSRALNYFYLNGNLHKKLRINRAADEIITWCYPLGKRVTYTYSDVKRRKEPAFTTAEVSKMLNRKRQTIAVAIMEGNIRPPQATYGLNGEKNMYKYMWSEKDILEAHAFFLTQHCGRPRKDGIIVPMYMPSVRELRAMIRQEEPLYVRTDDGEFVPVWRAPDFS